MPFITMKKAGQLMGVSNSTLIRWTQAGLLKYSRTIGGHRRIDLTSLQDIANRNLHQIGNADGNNAPSERRGSDIDLTEVLRRRPCDLGQSPDTDTDTDTDREVEDFKESFKKERRSGGALGGRWIDCIGEDDPDPLGLNDLY